MASISGWLKANHPELSWGEPGRQRRSFSSSPQSESEEKFSPGKKLPRKAGPSRDFSHLSPGEFSRHPGSESEKTSMEEWGAEAIPGSRPGKLKLRSDNVLDQPAKRDSDRATRKKV